MTTPGSGYALGIGDKVSFLQRKASYPDPTTRVETVETHMAWVFLTDEYAYKLKKPVRYDFLDFSTVEARHVDCAAEVRLNRRLAPGVYLGVVPLTVDARGRLELGGDGEVVDWAVRMRRLPRSRMLDALISRGDLDEAEVVEFAKRLAEFYRDAHPVPMDGATYRGRFEANIRGNLRELTRPEFGLAKDPVERVAAELLGFLESRAPLFDRRVEERRIIESHGDLRPEHVFLMAEPIVIDCLEFNRDFRILDPVDELAFFGLECRRLGAPTVGELVLDTYRAVTGDRPPSSLVRFYTSHRALLRAKIAIWHIVDGEIPEPSAWVERTLEYLAMAREPLPFEQLDDGAA